MKNNLNFARNQKGLTLPELTVGVLLIALAFVIIYAFAKPIQNMFKGTNDVQNVMLMDQNLVRLGQTGSYGTGTLMPRLKPSIPTSWKTAGTAAAPTVTNMYSGTVTAIGQDTTYTASVTNYPSGACADLVMALKGADLSKDVSAGSNAWGPGTAADQNSVAAACAVSNSNTITWTGQQ